MRCGVVVGNLKPNSGTLHAAKHIAADICGVAPDPVLDLITLGPALLRFGADEVADAVKAIQAVDVLIVASPTYKASFSGVLKLFLDLIPTNGLDGVIALPVMLGGSADHALAPDAFLTPVLVQLGATCPAPGLFLIEQTFLEDPRVGAWMERVKPLVKRKAP